MKLVTIRTTEGTHPGIVTDKGIVDLSEFMPEVPDVKSLIENFSIDALGDLSSKAVNKGEFIEESEVDLGPAIDAPGKIICIGKNYGKHAAETNSEIPKFPILFNKFRNALSGDNDTVQLPDNAEKIDYEAELAIVIGKEAKNVDEASALNYVFGYCAANDLSARDLQFRTNQWLLGKSLDGFCPLGPHIVTADEIQDPNALDISCTVNGDIRQQSNTRDMLFPCKEIVSYISQYMTLKPGDVILTGTPEGVILGYDESKQVWLQDGDTITVEIERIGKLSNTMKK
ncbi:fumarylacetoacetate hydrolase family protein [Virgibacillus siamensis]|uniref:fumarylacetoacetate hydrolase family protein n=1 Tax=Virgibacillus siamensis TaxID=480071 RepID=UPI000985B210|nr:fumarylacetoacetate hydrolase family protein [Virgibacillus siamensis]